MICHDSIAHSYRTAAARIRAPHLSPRRGSRCRTRMRLPSTWPASSSADRWNCRSDLQSPRADTSSAASRHSTRSATAGNGSLDTRARSLISVAITAALGTHEPLRGQLRIALNNGVSKSRDRRAVHSPRVIRRRRASARLVSDRRRRVRRADLIARERAVRPAVLQVEHGRSTGAPLVALALAEAKHARMPRTERNSRGKLHDLPLVKDRSAPQACAPPHKDRSLSR
jgi:Carboxymuconolactone decarboxylase family